MARKSKCCVPTCDKNEYTTHRFPFYYEEVYNIWIKRIAHNKLIEMDPIKVHKTYTVCDKHFSEDCKIPNSKKLKLYSLPSLYLPGPSNESEYSIFAFPTSLVPSSNSVQEQGPSTSQGEFVAVADNAMEISPPVAEEHHTPSEDIMSTPCKKRQRTRTYSTGQKRRNNLLREINIANKSELTPRKAFLYKAASQLREQTSKLTKRCLSFKQRLGAAESLAESDFFKTLMDSVDKVTFGFIMCQIRNKKLKPRGRRFTSEDKIMALALYKQSGKGYRLLSKMFALPSRKTMMSMLTKIPFNTGINNRVFANLRKTTSKLSLQQRQCVLLFDEMSLTANLQYIPKDDEVIGFEDLGSQNRKGQFADHALVFMVRGVCKKFKQPVAYYFTRSETTSVSLVRILKQVIRAVTNAGLKIVATVCDQAQTNAAAINYLKKDTRAAYVKAGDEYRGLGYEVDGQEIIHLFDSPHLLKGVRNNLLTKNAVFEERGVKKTAKWDHIVELYELDKCAIDADFKLLPKLTDYHVVPSKIKKMKVSYAAQIMSQRVSSIMRRLAEFSGESTKKLVDPAATETADFLLLIDKLFDSVNGSSVSPKHGKFLRCAVTKNSKHVEFWNEAIEVLESVRFVCPKTNKLTEIPSVKNWISNLKCFKVICDKLLKGGMKFINLRAFNQDPIENYFGQIRSHGFRNTNPTASSFRSSFKSLLLTNFVSSHSVGANCEEDETDGALNNLQSFVLDNVEEEDTDEQEIIKIGAVVNESEEIQQEEVESSEATKYVAGYVAKKLLAKKKCDTCSADISGIRDPASIISAREYATNALFHPSEKFVALIEKIKLIFHTNVTTICEKRNVRKEIMKLIMSRLKNEFSCHVHHLHEEVVEFVVVFLLFTYVKIINQILSGKVSDVNCKDKLKILAIKYCKRRESFRLKFKK